MCCIFGCEKWIFKLNSNQLSLHIPFSQHIPRQIFCCRSRLLLTFFPIYFSIFLTPECSTFIFIFAAALDSLINFTLARRGSESRGIILARLMDYEENVQWLRKFISSPSLLPLSHTHPWLPFSSFCAFCSLSFAHRMCDENKLALTMALEVRNGENEKSWSRELHLVSYCRFIGRDCNIWRLIVYDNRGERH